MYLYTVTNDAVFANLHVVADFLSANDAVFINVNVVADNHFGVAETTLLLYMTWSYHALLTDDCINAH